MNCSIDRIALEGVDQLKAVPSARSFSAPGDFGLGPLESAPYLELERGSLPRRALRVGVLFSGGPAPGGHDLIAGLLEALEQIEPKSQLLGFECGVQGLLQGQAYPVTRQRLLPYRGKGGFDLLGTSRLRLDPDQRTHCARVAKELKLDGLLVVGGDDSQTNAAWLACELHNSPCAVVGVPKTIDGDLRGAELCFGFDTATDRYSQLIGNLQRDCLSVRKYYHFVRLMGRSASHITLECALRTQPTWALIGEEVASCGVCLETVADQLAQLIDQRHRRGIDYGVIVLPEGLLEFLPGAAALLEGGQLLQGAFPAPSRALERDPHGNLPLSAVETERLLIEWVQARLTHRVDCVPHFFGYEGRSSDPTPLDCEYAYALGQVAACLIRCRANGYLATLSGLAAQQIKAEGVPLASLMQWQERAGERRPVVGKTTVDLTQPAFQALAKQRPIWSLSADFGFPNRGQRVRLPLSLLLNQRAVL